MRNVFNPQPEPKPEASPSPPGAPIAWQPFTFRGVAAFAYASYQRLFWFQTFFAVLCAGTITWAVHYAWTPVIRAAVRNLPHEAPARTEQLVSPPSAEPLLAESRHLAILLKPNGTSAAADVRIEFHPRALRVCSLFGCYSRTYPTNGTIYFTRPEAIPWWDAWQPILLGIIAVASGLFFLAAWSLLATLAFLFVRLGSYFADRQITLGGSWKLSAAALLPGSLALAAAVVLYALGIADLIRLILAIPGHVLIGMIYVSCAPRRLSPISVQPSNPFTATGERDRTSM